MGTCADCGAGVQEETAGFVCPDCAMARLVSATTFLAERRQQRAREKAEREAQEAERPAPPGEG